MNKSKVLVVDDEPRIQQSLRAILEDEGYEVGVASSGEECLKYAELKNYACILLDIWLPGIDGLRTLQLLREQGNNCPVIMISGHGNIEIAVTAVKLGAFDFIEKPFSIEKTVLTVRNAIRAYQLELKNAELIQSLDQEYVMIGDSVAMRALRKQIRIVAETDGRVLITGESGTGKELVARAIHNQSKRKDASFVEINSAAIPEDLIESELFGYVKGAFSGATHSRKGKLEIADGGTLFLDEIGDMSPRMQAKLLRVLEEGRFEPLGSNTQIKVDVRVISATNKNLDELIESGNFRHDLFYRLNVIPFEIPPLRERIEDIPLLVEHFNKKFSASYGKKPKEFTQEAIQILQSYAWPGNVRELKNTVERIVITVQKEKITPKELPPLSIEPISSKPARFPSLKEAIEDFQRKYIEQKINEAGGNISKAAELMGIDRSHLYRRIKSLGIDIEKF
ncbi:MAG: sigma-54 dependent transcriptional regulator [Pyrinomonadaceae bacterium]|nr:sigma-54 dependent transcriptional regulator [Pyrinomonadaceae bacterium]MCX7639284.1 sigma-54 dependent transcriptional regulator [Pyrinomonadaceae bacterium]MDW8303494.1 sigma-54 dependent transcriptional regulator [Acidobacteriota bacterium]